MIAPSRRLNLDLARFVVLNKDPGFSRVWEELANAIVASKLFAALIVDGSFVTEKAAPNDIDLIAILRPGHNFERELSMAEYALVSRGLLRRRFGFDVVVAEEDDPLYRTYVDFFSRVRDEPGLRKGMLRIVL